jgi:DNA-binding CsgD family transcriptional regulator
MRTLPGSSPAELPRTRTALEAAFEALPVPALVLDRGAAILFANRKARALLGNRRLVRRALTEAVATGSGEELVWDLTPLRDIRGPLGFLGLLREPAGPARGSNAVRFAALRWNLTPRQAEVLDLVARGLTNAGIADTLRIGKGTVEFHLSALFDKAGVDNRSSLVSRLLDL